SFPFPPLVAFCCDGTSSFASFVAIFVVCPEFELWLTSFCSFGSALDFFDDSAGSFCIFSSQKKVLFLSPPFDFTLVRENGGCGFDCTVCSTLVPLASV